MTQTEGKKNVSIINKLGSALPKSYLKHRVILIILMAVLVFGYVFIFMPRTGFSDTAAGAKSTARELTAGSSVTQEVTLSGGTLKSLLIDFDTYYRRNVAEYTVEVFTADGTPLTEADGSPVKKVFNADKMTEGVPFGVSLNPQAVSAGETIRVKISTDQAQPGRALGLVIKTGGNTPPAQVLANGRTEALSGSLSIQTGYDSFSKNALAIAAILVIALAVAILFWGDKLHINALILLLIFGVMFSLVTPVWDTPDEGVHNASAVLLSEGQLTAAGGNIPDSYEAIKQNNMKPLTEQTLSGTPQNPNSQYTPWGGGKFFLGFIPQALGVGIAKLLSLDMAAYFYMGRIFNAIAYAILAFFAIKRVKKFQIFFAAVSLLPMSLIIAASYNPDGVTYGLGLLLCAEFTNMCFDRKREIDWRQMLTFGIIAALLVMNKYTLGLLCLLPLFIPASRYVNKKTKWLWGFAILAACLIGSLLIVLWQTAGSGGGSSLTGDVNGQGASVTQQLAWILANPSAALSVYSKTIVGNLGADLMQLFTIGQLSYDVYSIFMLVYFAFLALVAFSYARQDYREQMCENNVSLSLVSRGMVLLCILGSVLLTYIALHLTWTPVGADTILGVQGRYYVPLLALLPFIGQNSWPRVTEDAYHRSRINIMFVAAATAAVTLITTLLKYY